jgi:hypothetical protein
MYGPDGGRVAEAAQLGTRPGDGGNTSAWSGGRRKM